MHDSEGRSRYALEWYRGRWHILSGEYEEALEHYRLAVTHSAYRAGEMWKEIVAEAMALSGYVGNAKPFLKQLKHQAIALGLFVEPGEDNAVVEDWELEDLRKRFQHIFPRQGRFVEVEQPDDDVGALPFLMYDRESLAGREPNYRKPDQVATVLTIDNQVRRWSQLSLYATFGSLDVVKKLLEKGASVDALDNSDGSALLGAIQRAADSNEREVLDLLLTYSHSKATLNQRTARKRLTPLIRAIDYGEPDVVAKLLAMGADANLRGHGDDQTPLYLCTRNMGGLRAASSLRQMLLKSVSSDQDSVLRETLRRYGVGVAGVFGDKRSVFDAMRNPVGHEIFGKVVDLIIEDFIGRHTAAKQLQIAEHLLIHGANPNASHNSPAAGRTPLMLAVENDSLEAGELLMRYGGGPLIPLSPCCPAFVLLGAGRFLATAAVTPPFFFAFVRSPFIPPRRLHVQAQTQKAADCQADPGRHRLLLPPQEPVPPEKLAFLDPGMDVITALFEEALAAREAERIAREAAEAAKKAVHDSHIAVCEARIADLLATLPRNPFDDDQPPEGSDNDADKPPTLH